MAVRHCPRSFTKFTTFAMFTLGERQRGDTGLPRCHSAEGAIFAEIQREGVNGKIKGVRPGREEGGVSPP